MVLYTAQSYLKRQFNVAPMYLKLNWMCLSPNYKECEGLKEMAISIKAKLYNIQ